MTIARPDYAAFDAPYDRAAASSLAATLRATRPTSFKQPSALSFIDVIALVAFIPVIVVFLPLTISVWGQVSQMTSSNSNYSGLLTAALTLTWFVLGSAAFIWYTIHRYVGRARKYRDVETWWRLQRFAESNNLLFSPWTAGPSYPSRFFRSGATVASYDHLRAQADPFFDMGNLFTNTGEGDGHTFDRRWGFIAIHLDRELPQIVLDAKANGRVGYGNLPVVPESEQVLSLEGDFNDHFTLYAPLQAQRDALFIFTPDLMALFIDEIGTLDAEIVGEWLFVYSTTPFDMRRRDVVERLLRIVEVVGTKTRDRAERFVRSETHREAAGLPAPVPVPVFLLGLRKRYPKAIVVAIVVAVLSVPGLITAIVTFTAGSGR